MSHGESQGDGWRAIPIVGAVVACGCMIVGWNWDICWHRSIGRDTVWTLPHIAIYVALALAFVYNAILVLSFTFGARKDTPAIRVLGFRAPGGAFVTLWGILLQFMAILFDDWWHGIYGLDIGVFSPPHALLAWGIGIFYLGQFVLVATLRNQTAPRREAQTRWALLLIAAFLIGHFSLAMDASYGPRAVRTHAWMITSATWAPFALLLSRIVIGRKSASVWAAAFYMLFVISLMQIFRQFPASPTFGPVFHRIDHFLPPPFPMALIVPAAAMTWAYGIGNLGRWKRAALVAVVFLVSFHATNWATSAFLMSPAAENAIFGGIYPGAYFEETYRPVKEMTFGGGGALVASLKSTGIAFLAATGMLWVAQTFGDWLKRVVR